MIQRIQSLYLSLTIILTLLFLKGGILNFINNAGGTVKVTLTGAWQFAGQGEPQLISRQLPLAACVFLIIIIGTVAIFMFKNRKLQINLVLFVILLSIILTGLFCFYGLMIMRKFDMEMVWGFRMFIPLAGIILSTLALRAIRRDDELVKSYDRLR